MVGIYFDGLKEKKFEKWLKQVVGRDDRYKHLLVEEFEEERLAFYNYFERGYSPWRALQEEYYQYG